MEVVRVGRQAEESHVALETTDRGGPTMCEVHRPLAYMTAVLCVASPSQITGCRNRGKEGESFSEEYWI